MAKIELMGSHEIRVRLGGISRQRVYQITNSKTFPDPVAELEMGKVWLKSNVEKWIRQHRPDL
jgi:prophage regulatory protein